MSHESGCPSESSSRLPTHASRLTPHASRLTPHYTCRLFSLRIDYDILDSNLMESNTNGRRAAAEPWLNPNAVVAVDVVVFTLRPTPAIENRWQVLPVRR